MSKIVLFSVVQRLSQGSPVAVLIPEDISATAVPHGEREFHSFLKILFEARPDVSGGSSGNPPEGLPLGYSSKRTVMTVRRGVVTNVTP
jgi:hypothetical protein